MEPRPFPSSVGAMAGEPRGAAVGMLEGVHRALLAPSIALSYASIAYRSWACHPNPAPRSAGARRPIRQRYRQPFRHCQARPVTLASKTQATAMATSSAAVAPSTQVGTTEHDARVPQSDNLAVDAYADDGTDSAYDSEVASYTTSLASSATDYKFMHGRRYHSYKEGSYMFPNDEQESDRLDILHKVIEKIHNGKLHYAPLKNPKRAIDIGTGTGIWAMEFGDEYPQCDVLGNDLSPIQPRWVPPNVHFEVDDAEAEWTYSQKFDYIHSRTMSNAIHDWPKFVRQCYDNVVPGGWVEFCDWDITWVSPDNSLKEDSAMYKLNREFIKAIYDAGGPDPCPGPKLEKWVTDAGFEEIQVWKHPAPFGTWPADKRMKEIGAWNYLQVVEGLEGLVYYVFTKILNLSKEEVDVAVAKFRSELKNPRIHPLCYLYVVIGKKPEDKTTEDDGKA